MIQILIAGLSMGVIYALAALSFLLIYNSVGALHFGLSEFVMLGTFFIFTLNKIVGLDPGAAVILGLVCSAVFGVIFERLVYQPLKGRHILVFAISTVAFGIMLKNAALIIWGADPRGMESIVGTATVQIFGGVISSQYLVIAGVAVILLVALYLLFFKTRLGRQMRATAQDAEMAQMMGINTGLNISVIFALASVLAAIAGWLLAPLIFVFPDMGRNIFLKGFVALVIGGFGNIPGAVVGGLLLGVLEVLLAGFVSSAYRDAMTFSILILVLIVMPRGLFGEAINERA